MCLTFKALQSSSLSSYVSSRRVNRCARSTSTSSCLQQQNRESRVSCSLHRNAGCSRFGFTELGRIAFSNRSAEGVCLDGQPLPKITLPRRTIEIFGGAGLYRPPANVQPVRDVTGLYRFLRKKRPFRALSGCQPTAACRRPDRGSVPGRRPGSRSWAGLRA